MTHAQVKGRYLIYSQVTTDSFKARWLSSKNWFPSDARGEFELDKRTTHVFANEVN
jgi:hypothetical protein